MLNQLRVVLVDTPDVSARTAIVRDIRVHAWERQIVGGVLATRRTGRTRHAGSHCFSHGMCQLSHKRIGHVAGRRVKAEVVRSHAFRQPLGDTHCPAGGEGGINPWGREAGNPFRPSRDFLGKTVPAKWPRNEHDRKNGNETRIGRND